MSSPMPITEKDSNQPAITKKSFIDFLLFLILSCLNSVFTCGRLSKTPIEGYGNPTHFYGKWSYYPGLPFEPYILIPCYIIFFVLLMVLRSRLRKKIVFNKGIIAIYIAFLVTSTISIWFSPKGPRSYTYTYLGSTFQTSTEGLSGINYLTSFLNQIFFYSYLCAFFLFIAPLTKENTLCFRLLSLIRQRITFSRIIYALIYQREYLVYNLVKFFHKGDSFFVEITSYTHNRNVFGFFLFRAFLFAFSDFRRNENIVSFLLCSFYLVFCVFIISKTPSLLRLSLSALYSIYYPITHYKKKKGWSIFFISILAIALLLFLIVIIRFKGFTKYIFSIFTQMSTRFARYYITNGARSRMNQNVFISLFGYGRYPFAALFTQMSGILNDGTVLSTSHICYVDIFLEFGRRGIILLASCYLLAGCDFIRKRIKTKNPDTFIQIIILVALSIYSFSEPRAIFLREGNCLFFIFFASTFYLEDARAEKGKTGQRKKDLTHRLGVCS